VFYGPGEYGAGDVAVFQTPEGDWLRHELVEETDRGWITQGTNEPHPDQWSAGSLTGIPPVQQTQIAGVVYAAIPLPIVVSILVALLAALASIGLYWTRKTWRPPAVRLLSAGREVTSRLSTVERQHIAAIAVAILAILAPLSGIGPIPAGIVAADTNTTYDSTDIEVGYVDRSNNLKYIGSDGSVSDTEVQASSAGGVADVDGDNDNDIAYRNTSDKINFVDAGGNTISTNATSGDLGGVGDIDGDGDLDVAYTDANDQNLKYVDSDGNIGDTGAGSDFIGAAYDIDDDGDIEVAASDRNDNLVFVDSAGVDTSTSIAANDVGGIGDHDNDGNLEIPYVDPGSNTLYLYDISDGSTASLSVDAYNAGPIADFDEDSDQDVVYKSTSNYVRYIDASGNDANLSVSAYGVGGAGDIDGDGLGVEVSGNVSGSDGAGIGSATVYLNQSGNNVGTTTTSSDGSYSFSGVSDGDYTIEATADGYQSSQTDIQVSGSPVEENLTLFESGTFEREFQLGPDAVQTYPPTKSTLHVYRWDRALEFPLPGGKAFRAGPGTWTKVATSEFNGYGKAWARLENGKPYRVEVIASDGSRSTRWESLGWRADKDRDDPFLISVGSTSDSTTATPTPTGTSTVTPTPAELGTPTETGGTAINGGGQAPSDPFDEDGDGDFFDDPDAENDSTRSPTVAGANSGFGPRFAGECQLADGSTGLLVEYWDPDYDTTQVTYNLTHENSSYAGERTFDVPAGYTTWCISDQLTNNASTGEPGLRGNLTRGGNTSAYAANYSQGSLVAAVGPMGDAPTGPVGTAGTIGITLAGMGAALVAGRRFFPAGPESPLPISPVGLAGAGVAGLIGLNAATGNLLGFAAAIGVEQVAPALAIIGTGAGTYFVYKEYVVGDDIVLRESVPGVSTRDEEDKP